jgi:hypothetical protein
MNEPQTLTFGNFWAWLVSHPNCIVRAGTPTSVLYDEEDFHWHFAAEGSETLLVQVLRGKRLIGELFVEPEQVSYVQGQAGEQAEEFVFELVAETPNERYAAYFFVLSHGFDGEAPTTPGRVH